MVIRENGEGKRATEGDKCGILMFLSAQIQPINVGINTTSPDVTVTPTNQPNNKFLISIRSMIFP